MHYQIKNTGRRRKSTTHATPMWPAGVNLAVSASLCYCKHYSFAIDTLLIDRKIRHVQQAESGMFALQPGSPKKGAAVERDGIAASRFRKSGSCTTPMIAPATRTAPAGVCCFVHCFAGSSRVDQAWTDAKGNDDDRNNRTAGVF